MNASAVALYIIVAGLLLITAGFALQLASIPSQVSVGGVVFIGPFPIVFGAGPGYQYLIPISIVIAVIMLVLAVIFYWRARSKLIAGERES